MATVPENTQIFVGSIVHCTEPFTAHTLEKGFVLVEGSQIIAIDHVSELEHTRQKLGLSNVEEVVLGDSQILIPGLVDTHLHAPQYPNVGLGYDLPLLEWLDTYTFPLEAKYKDTTFASKIYDAIVRKTIAHGTTTACYFGSLYNDSNMLLVDAAIQTGQRALVGKVNMTSASHYDYQETAEENVQNTIEFVRAVLGRKSALVKPIITPRFALSLEMEDMKRLGEIANKFDLHIQSHISENLDEVKLVREKFGKAYAEVYDEAQLLTNKTILAHGIYLNECEMKLLAERGTSVAHCPESNTCLQSGICDVRKLIHHGLTVGLGTDISGGGLPSIVSAMRSAIQSSIHLSLGKNNYDPLNCYDVFFLATLGGAKALALDSKIGNFEVGKEFDALVIDMDVDNSSVDYLHNCRPMELLQKFIYVGDDRNVIAVYISGKRVR